MLCLKFTCVIPFYFQTLKTVRNVHKLTLNMNSAYFNYDKGEDNFQLTFLYQNKKLGVERDFNFSRLISESIDTLLGRINTNVGKIVQKKINRINKKSKGDEVIPPVDIAVKMLNNGVPVSGSLNCFDVFFKHSHIPTLILQIEDVSYTVIINSPWIHSINLPSNIMAGFMVYPCSFETKFTDKSKSTFMWFKSNVVRNSTDQPNSWTNVSKGYFYKPMQKDIGCKLKLICTPGNQTMTGPVVEVESKTLVEAGPGMCPFESRHAFTKTRLKGESFRVLSYNILADMYANSDDARNILFPYCAKYALTIDYRKQLFVKELLGYNADIMCLQEVDSKVYDMDFTPVLGDIGYEGHFAKKTTVSEGLACFYLTSRYKQLESHMVTFGEDLKANKDYCSHIWKNIEKITALATKISELGTCGQAVVLQCLDKRGEILVIGNTHLYFHPEADHIRLLQAGTFIAYLQQLVETVAKKHSGHRVSLILCGDFNSVPECGIYKLMTTKEVPEDFIDWRSKADEAVKGLTLKQPYALASACGTPKYTNFTVGFADCLDYIFYQTDRLKVEQVIPLPSEEELKMHSAIPSVVFPSDHIALIADLKYR